MRQRKVAKREDDEEKLKRNKEPSDEAERKKAEGYSL